MVRFVNDFLFIFFVIIGCTLDTGLMLGEEMRQLVSGAIVHGSQEENDLAMKVCLDLFQCVATCQILEWVQSILCYNICSTILQPMTLKVI